MDETLAALNLLVRSGKVRYLGASSRYAWQFSKALYRAEAQGLTGFISMQNHYNLLNREEEREMIPLCEDQGVGVLTWSPLARGRLAREADAHTTRTRDDAYGDSLYSGTERADQEVVVAAVAGERGVPMASVALAWLLSKPYVTAPLVGATRPQQLADALTACDLALSADEAEVLERAYVPHRVAGFE